MKLTGARSFPLRFVCDGLESSNLTASAEQRKVSERDTTRDALILIEMDRVRVIGLSPVIATVN